MNDPALARRLPAWRRRLNVWLIAAGAAGGLGAAPAPPVDAFFGLPSVAGPQLSPDGRRIAFRFPLDGRMAIGVFDRGTGEAHSVVRGKDESLAAFIWKGNDRIVFVADVGGNESAFIGSTDLAGRNILRIAESQKAGHLMVGTSARIVDPLRTDARSIILDGYFGTVPTDDRIALPIAPSRLIARVNVRNGGYGAVFTTNQSDRYLDLVFDNAGVLRVMAREENGSEVWLCRPDAERPFKEIARFALHGIAEQWTPFFFAADNRTLYLLSREENDRGALYAFDTATRQRGPALFVPPEGEILEVITSEDRRRLYGVAYESDRLHFHWFDAGRAALQRKLENTFPGMECRVVSRSADEQVHLVWVGSDRDPGAFFVLDDKAGTLTLFKRASDLDPRAMRPMQPIAFAARDGLELHGYLTLPAGAEGRRVPLIIHPHGGPYGLRDSWGFNPEVQFLASRGYAVLQLNYRGSGGYGRAFIDRGRYQWGRAMQDDLTDAVKWAVDQGIADPARVAIYGASYGGYAALAGVTLTPDLYRCAVNYVGVADLDQLMIESRAFLFPADFDYLEAWIGPTQEYRRATSPVHFVERIRVPTLHAYGANDPRVKIKQWDSLEAQLRKYHKPYQAIEEKYQGHGFHDEAQSIHFHEVLERFLADNLGPGNPP